MASWQTALVEWVSIKSFRAANKSLTQWQMSMQKTGQWPIRTLGQIDLPLISDEQQADSLEELGKHGIALTGLSKHWFLPASPGTISRSESLVKWHLSTPEDHPSWPLPLESLPGSRRTSPCQYFCRKHWPSNITRHHSPMWPLLLFASFSPKSSGDTVGPTPWTQVSSKVPAGSVYLTSHASLPLTNIDKLYSARDVAAAW